MYNTASALCIPLYFGCSCVELARLSNWRLRCMTRYPNIAIIRLNNWLTYILQISCNIVFYVCIESTVPSFGFRLMLYRHAFQFWSLMRWSYVYALNIFRWTWLVEFLSILEMWLALITVTSTLFQPTHWLTVNTQWRRATVWKISTLLSCIRWPWPHPQSSSPRTLRTGQEINQACNIIDRDGLSIVNICRHLDTLDTMSDLNR